MIKVGAIIFSRMQSQRLPGKAMINISGKLLIERVIERTQKIKLIDHICLATSNLKNDDIINNYAISKGLDTFRGDQNDVVLRAFSAGSLYNYDCFVRICGDRPFFDGKIVDEIRRNSDWRENVDAIAAILDKMETKDFRLVAVDEDCI